MLLLFFAFMIVVETYYLYHPRNYYNKGKYLDEHAPSIQTLIVGNSTVFTSIDPNVLPGHAYNLALPEERLLTTLRLLEHVTPDMDQLHTIIIGVNYATFFIDINDQFRHERFYWIHLGIKPREMVKNLFATFKERPKVVVQNLKNFVSGTILKQGQPGIRVLDHGLGHLTYVSDSDMDFESDARFHMNHHIRRSDVRFVQENTRRLIEVVTSEQFRKFRIILVQIPAHPAYQKLQSDDWMQMNGQIVDRVLEACSNCEFKDYSPEESLAMDSYYTDVIHLSREGAVRLTNMMLIDFGLR